MLKFSVTIDEKFKKSIPTLLAVWSVVSQNFPSKVKPLSNPNQWTY